jgi:hypothetical protein
MGEDFIRKTERTYRRSLQRSVERQLLTPPLFQPKETTHTSYPCRLRDDAPLPDECTQYLLHRRDHQTFELLDQNRVIGIVDGEAAHDLNSILESCPDPADILRVTPRRVDGNFLDFTVDDEK